MIFIYVNRIMSISTRMRTKKNAKRSHTPAIHTAIHTSKQISCAKSRRNV